MKNNGEIKKNDGAALTDEELNLVAGGGHFDYNNLNICVCSNPVAEKVTHYSSYTYRCKICGGVIPNSKVEG